MLPVRGGSIGERRRPAETVVSRGPQPVRFRCRECNAYVQTSAWSRLVAPQVCARCYRLIAERWSHLLNAGRLRAPRSGDPGDLPDW